MSDGYHIALLVIAALQYLAPQFIQEGRLCWLHAPLYLVKNGKQEQYYYSDEELNKVRKNIKGTLSRFKGLGSMEAEQMHNSMFTEEYQHLETIIPNEESIQLLYDLMGPDVEPRREFIFKNVDFSQVRE